MTSTQAQLTQHSEFRHHLPDRRDPRFAAMARGDAYTHARELLYKQQPAPLYGLYMHWQKLLAEPFKGITNDGYVRPNLYHLRDEGVPIATTIVPAARAVVDALSPSQRMRTLLHIDSPEWRTWTNQEVLISDKRVRLDEIAPPLRSAIHRLLRATLSSEGYAKVRTAMRLNGFLGGPEAVNAPRVINEYSYNFVMFGTEPSDARPWGYALYGHNLSVSVLLYRNQIVISPCFVGAEPNLVNSGPHKSQKILQNEERFALQLMQSLTPEKQARAQVYKNMQNDSAMPPGRWNPVDERLLCAAYRDNRVVPYEGLLVSEMTTEQQALMTLILEQFIIYLPELSRRLKLQDFERFYSETYFCWIGRFGDMDPFYYRVQSPLVLVEFDHQAGRFLTNQKPAKFHSQTLLRAPNGGDYGHALRQAMEGSVDQNWVWDEEVPPPPPPPKSKTKLTNTDPTRKF